MVGDGSRRRDRSGWWRVCGSMGMVATVGVSVGKATVESGKVLRGRTAGVALSAGLVAGSGRSSHGMEVVVVEQAGHTEEVSHTHQVGPQLLHHLVLRARV